MNPAAIPKQETVNLLSKESARAPAIIHPIIAEALADPKTRAATPISVDLIVLRNVGVHVKNVPIPKPERNDVKRSIFTFLVFIGPKKVVLKEFACAEGLGKRYSIVAPKRPATPNRRKGRLHP